jgi:serine/threonine protein kinase/Tol biopolymer transport system component
MPLAPGARLGPYEILSALGAGGMGEVYRARDSRLRRDVAIKVLASARSADPDRLVRFEQEARAAAALNHPNILAVHDIGTEADAPFIVSELLEGQTLRERLLSGAIPVRKVLGYGAAIVRGLAAAHEKGIIHRDLKPENLFVTTDDRIKILDFGLAKLNADRAADAAASTLPTSPAHTEFGVVLGTVGYMAPEQVRGLPVDHRADLFAFGAILHELLSGRRAFHRETSAETMTAILNTNPPSLTSSEHPIPPVVAHIVERCLEKNPAARFQTASDLAFALESVADVSSASTAVRSSDGRQRGWRAWIGWGVAALVLLALAPLVYEHVREQPVAREPIRFQIPLALELPTPATFALSPDGRHLAFFGRSSDGVVRLWLRDMNSLAVRVLPGSETVGPGPPPFWSPDSRFIAFDAGFKLKKIDVSGGPPQTLCDLPGVAVGGSWNRQGDIIVGNAAGGVLRVPENGGAASPVTTIDPTRKEEAHLLPSFLSDGRHFVYLRVSPSAADTSGSFIGTLDAKPGEQSLQPLMPYVVGLTFAPSNDTGVSRLMFVREGTLMAQVFDESRLTLVGGPVPVAERVGSFRDGGYFATSANDVLVYRAAETDFQVTWFDRKGALSSRVSDSGAFRDVALSPDGTRAVTSRTDPQDPAKADLWLLDLARGTGAIRLTFGDGLAEGPVWSPDGARIAYTFNNASIRQRRVNGDDDATLLLQVTLASFAAPNSWSSDGRFLLYTASQEKAAYDLWVLPSDGQKAVPFARTGSSEIEGRFSPDGRWVAYVSDQSGDREVYVRGYTNDFSSGSASVGTSILISRDGGVSPRWSKDGRELFYLASDGMLMAAEVTKEPGFVTRTPVRLFQTPPGTIMGDVSADGQRFLLVTPVGPSASSPFTVVLNWTSGLKK